MRATRLSLMVLLVVLAFVLWNAAWVTDRCGEWTAALDEAEAALEQGGSGHFIFEKRLHTSHFKFNFNFAGKLL